MLRVRSWLLISLIVALCWMGRAVGSVPPAEGNKTVEGTIKMVAQDKKQFQLIDADGQEWTFHVAALPLIVPKAEPKPAAEAPKSVGEAPDRFEDLVWSKSTSAFADVLKQLFSTNMNWLEHLKPGQEVKVTYEMRDGRRMVSNVQRK